MDTGEGGGGVKGHCCVGGGIEGAERVRLPDS